MRFLIVTASVGSGHEQAAKAVVQGVKEYLPEAEVELVDYMAPSTSWLNYASKKIYLFMLNMVPYLYEAMYNFTAGPKRGSAVQAVAAAIMSRTIKKLIRQYEPDVIICTHPFPADAISHLSKEWREKFTTAVLITDYTVHPLWICQNVDLYFVAHSAMQTSLYAQGIKPGTVFDTGIPVDSAFYEKVDKKAVRQELGFEPDTPLILMMGGGLGLGGMEEAMEQLEQVKIPLQVLVVAGRNQELYESVKQKADKSRHRVKVLGFTDRIRDFMGTADLLISKPGGMTLTEAMNMQLPMLLNQPIPGPETDNARYMSDRGIGRWLRIDEPLAHVVEELVMSKEKLTQMGQSAAKHKRPYAAKKIVDNILTFIAKN